MAKNNPKPENAKDLHQWGLQLVEDGRNKRRVWEGIWWENIATYCGDLWTEWNIHDRKLLEAPKRPDHRVRLAINLAQPTTRTELAKLTKNRPMLDCIARSDEKTDLNAAEVGDKLLNNFIERKFYMPRVRRRALNWVLMCGLGGIFVDWDESAQSKVSVMVDPQGQPLADERQVEMYRAYYKKQKKAPRTEELELGEMFCEAVSPFQWIWDFSKIYSDDAAWGIYTNVYDVNEVEKRWGVEVESDPDVSPGVIEKRLLDKFDLTNKLALKRSDAQDLCEIHRLFIKPGHPWFPRGAHVVFNKDDVIHAENFPYGHGELPVSMMGHVPLPVSQYSMSVLQQVRGPVLELSRTVSQILENRNLMGNPPWRIAKQHQIDGPIVNKPGLRLEYQHNPNVPPPEPVQMPEMPVYVKELIPMMREHILEISGQGETSQGRVPPGARSGVAIAYLQEEDDTRLGPTVTEFEEMMERVAGHQLKIIAENYDVQRTITIYKPNGTPEVFDFIGTMLQGVSGVICQAGSALPRSKAAKQQYILDLWDRKLEQDPRRVRQMLELAEGEPDDFQIDMDQAERENRKLTQGQEVEVLEWHHHAAHHYVHRRYMKSADFEELEPDIQEMWLAHDGEHTRFEQQEQQEQMEMQAKMGLMGGGGSSNGATPEAPGAEGQNVPEGPPAEFSADIAPRDLMSDGPQ